MKASGAALASMSGFGRAEATAGGLRAVCEIRTVNHRHLDVALSLPSYLQEHDPELRKLVAESLGRGRADITVSVGAAGAQTTRPTLDLKLARWYGARLAALARELKAPPPRAEAIAQLPGVIVQTEAARNLKPAAALARGVLGEALRKLAVMRRREGASLAKDLTARLATVDRLAGLLEQEWPLAAARQRERTEAKLKQVLERLTETPSPASAAKDLVNSVERGDITEEITRLRSHVGQFREALAAGSPVGRKLDFLTQELHREVNTSGAKSTDTALTRLVVELKEEVERIREQVQNIE